MARPVRSGLGNELRLGRRCLLRTCLGISYQDVAGLVRAGLERPASVPADRHLGDLVALRVEGCDHRSRRSQGDFVLARSAAREYGHAQSASRAHPVVVVVGGGPGECWPITIVTVEPLVAWEPPSGLCDWTMPSWLGSATATYCWVTLKPAPSRSVTACCAVSPTTGGIPTCGGPFETWRATEDPFVAEVPGAGVWWMTWFCGAVLSTKVGCGFKPAWWSAAIAWASVSPTTLGTSAWAGPLMTFTRTLDPFGTDLPAGGSVAVTWPFVFPGTMRSTGTRPWSVSACCASVHCWPLTSGTLTLVGPLETEIVTVPPFSACEPALGFWLKTIPFL